MLIEKEFRKHLQGLRLSAENVDFTVRTVGEFEDYLEKRQMSFESASLDVLKDYISLLIKESKNSMDRLFAIARYCNFTRKNNHCIYLTSILGARNVLPDISERLATVVGEEARRKVFEDFELPPLGSPQENYPWLTEKVINKLEAELPSEVCRKILTWNYHKVPVEAFKEKKERFEKANSIDEFLKDEHRRLIEELTGCMREGRVWYEQEITIEVLEFVKGDQEISNGVRHGDRIFMTKMPFAPKQCLAEKDPVMKRYYACHCMLVKTAIRDGKPKIPPVFCYCSGGFEKLPYDVVFGEPVEIEMLESALKGDIRCRFAIKIPKGKMK